MFRACREVGSRRSCRCFVCDSVLQKSFRSQHHGCLPGHSANVYLCRGVVSYNGSFLSTSLVCAPCVVCGPQTTAIERVVLDGVSPFALSTLTLRHS